ncbi:MAG TPA: AraC family transcriptional regulator [Polyangiaceae bacterium]|jgi:AraC-like DNA-binding protein|nr:AraC family transcriptional regulator [Polyangiaceae bacterium]
MTPSLRDLIEQFTGKDGPHETELDGLAFYRMTAPADLPPTFCEPSLCVIAQGAKLVSIGDDRFHYDAEKFLVFSADLPVSARIVEASVERPYLSLALRLDYRTVCELAGQVDAASAQGEPIAAVSVSPAEPDLLEAVTRFVALLGAPRDRAVLGPLIQREIIYRLLTGPQAPRLRQLAMADGHARRILGILRSLKEHFASPLRIEELARGAHMSPSALFQHFKTVTGMSPLQYQKLLRLHEARRLMLGAGLDAAEASFRVGYESPSQFSREYRRRFGAPPRRDVESLRRSASAAAV